MDRKSKLTHRAYTGNRRRYYRWRIRKIIKEAIKATRNAEDFMIFITNSDFYWDAYIYVTKKGVFFQNIEYNDISAPQKMRNIDEAIEKAVNWILKHPAERWEIRWDRI